MIYRLKYQEDKASRGKQRDQLGLAPFAVSFIDIHSTSEISTTKGCPSLHLARTCNEVTFIPSQGLAKHMALAPSTRVDLIRRRLDRFWSHTTCALRPLPRTTCYKHRKTSICFQSQPKVPIDGVYSTKDARTAQGILYKSQTLNNTNSSNDSNHSQVAMP